MSYFGKSNLSCDVIVVNHLPHQVIVFERAHLKNNHLIGKLPKIITSRDSCQSPTNFVTKQHSLPSSRVSDVVGAKEEAG